MHCIREQGLASSQAKDPADMSDQNGSECAMSQALPQDRELKRTGKYLLCQLLLVIIPADLSLISIPDDELITTTPVHEPLLQHQHREQTAYPICICMSCFWPDTIAGTYKL